MFEINLVCPVCGGLEWAATPNNEVFECVACGCQCTKEEMRTQVFEN